MTKFLGQFWKLAVGACGLAAVAAYVFNNLNERFLGLGIFSQLSPNQTFWILFIFLSFVFLALIAMLRTYLKSRDVERPITSESLSSLAQAWRGTNHIDCQNLVMQDVVNATNVLTLTSSIWNNGLLPKNVVYEEYWPAFQNLYVAMAACKNIAPGLARPCCDMLDDNIRRAYQSMKAFR